jgi:hypothetical protein
VEEESTYTCDATLGDVPLTKASYASMMATGGDGFAAVTCIPAEEFMDYDAPLSLSAKMPNLISIGDRAFKGFAGGTFAFLALDESYLPRLEHIGVNAFAEFDGEKTTEATITLKGVPSLILIEESAFFTLKAPFLQLQVECACSNLEVIHAYAFVTQELKSASKITFTDLSRLQSIGVSVFNPLGSQAVTGTDLIFVGLSSQLTSIGHSSFL